MALLSQVIASATDWPQYRGTTTDGISPDPIATVWPPAGLNILWQNMSLTNGFSCFAVSQGRAFTMISKDDGTGTGSLLEYCVAVDAVTGAEVWETPVGVEPWDPASTGDGGAGTYPYSMGDGPRPTPSISNGRVFVLSSGQYYPSELHLLCLNFTNGSVVWSNDLVAAYGASTILWDNAASACLDNDLIFVNLNTANDGQNLAAFRASDGGLAWSAHDDGVTHTTPVIATLYGVRQVLIATQTGIVSLNRTNGAFLWKFTYPFSAIGTSMGASPVVYSNIMYCTASYGRGAAAARITLANGTWTAQQFWYESGFNYRSIWMTPVCYQGYIYTLCGENATFLTTPLNCIELSTGNLKWSQDNFGMGGLILVNTNLLVLTEDGQLVLVQPNPNAYTELARCRAFQFSGSLPGKCWNNPTFSNGRIYARSTAGGIVLDASVAATPALKLLAPQFMPGNRLQLWVGTTTGAAITSSRLTKMEMHFSTNVTAGLAGWAKLTNSLVLTNGLVRVDNVPIVSRSFYTVKELP